MFNNKLLGNFKTDYISYSSQQPLHPTDNTRVNIPVHTYTQSLEHQLQLSQDGQATGNISFVEFSNPKVEALSQTLSEKDLKELQFLYKFVEEGMQEQLDVLALSPQLLSQDSKGSSLLSNINRLIRGTFASGGIPTTKLASQLIKRLNDRIEVFQGPQYTCSSAALENYMLKHDSAEFSRIVTDLSIKGKSYLRDGSSLSLPDGMASYIVNQSTYSFEDGPDTRDELDVYFQSAVMQDVSLVGGDRAWKGSGSSVTDYVIKGFNWLTDWAGYDAEGDDSGIMAKLKGNGGGDPWLYEDLMEAMTGKRFERFSDLNLNNLFGNQSPYHNQLKRVAEEGIELFALLEDPLHYVVVTDYDPGEQEVTYLSTGCYPHDSHHAKRTEFITVSKSKFLDNIYALYSEQKTSNFFAQFE